MINDRREPGVYVSIEDASFVAPSIEVGRTVFMVGLCDRGPHNRVVTVTSQQEFQEKFGAPNFHRVSQSHYNMDKAMQYTGKGLYVRVVPEDSTVSNITIKENSAPTTTIGTETSFVFNQVPSGTVPPRKANYVGDQAGYVAALEAYNAAVKLAKTVLVTEQSAFDELVVGDWIYSGELDDIRDARQIVSKSTEQSDLQGFPSNTHGILILDEIYGNANVSNESGAGGMFPSGNSKSSTAIKYIPYIIVSQELEWDTDLLSLDPTIRSQSENQEGLATVDDDVIYTFYATGAGEYYNGLKIKGVRNSELEKLYTYDADILDLDATILTRPERENYSSKALYETALDDYYKHVVHREGDVKYKYLFMNIGVYETTANGYDRLVEGPWQVSLTRKTPDGIKIRDLQTGDVMYIQEVINKRSERIRCVAGINSANLSLSDSELNNLTSEKSRQRVMLMMSSSAPVSTNNYVASGNCLQLERGYDGTTDGSPLYTPAGNLYQSEEIWGKIKLAYMGSLTSVDGSIEQLAESVYPWFTPDYVVSGGFPAWVQDGARQLADSRQDVFHLGDTGIFAVRYEDDIDARLEYVPWIQGHMFN